MNTLKVMNNVLSIDELQLFIKLQQEIKSLKANLADVEKAMQEAESQLITKIDEGAVLATDQFVVSIREIERRFPAWKEHYIAVAGKDAADQVLNETEAKLYRNLVVKAS